LPDHLKEIYREAIQQEQLYDLERIYYDLGDDTSPLSQFILQLLSRLSNKYQVDELAANYQFTGNQALTIPEALEVKEELEKIDELLKQLEEARATAQLAILDMEALGEYMDEDTMHSSIDTTGLSSVSGKVTRKDFRSVERIKNGTASS